MDKWSNKIAVVTGASSGIGAAIAQAFLSNNLTVINLDKNLTDKHSDNDKFFQRQCDLTNLEQLKPTFEWIEENFQTIHILVNCAGYAGVSTIFETDDFAVAEINKTIDVNFRAVVNCTREGVRLMNKSQEHGMIINICSIVGHITPFMGTTLGIYTPTKHAIRAFSEIVRQELIITKNEKIRVSNISPGLVHTNLLRGLEDTIKEIFKDEIKLLVPENIAEAVLFLLTTPYNVNISELTIRPVGEKL